MKLPDKNKIVLVTTLIVGALSALSVFLYFLLSPSPTWGDFFLNFGTELIGVVVSIIVAVIIFEAYDKRRWQPVERNVAKRAQRYIDWYHVITMEFFNIDYDRKMREAMGRGELARVEKERRKRLDYIVERNFTSLSFAEINRMNSKLHEYRNSLESFLEAPGIYQIPELINWTSELLAHLQKLTLINQSVHLYSHSLITEYENLDEKKYLETNKNQFTKPLMEINNIVQKMQNFISSKYDVYPGFEIQLRENK